MAQANRLGSIPRKAALLATLALLTLALVAVQARPAPDAADKTAQGRGSKAQLLCPTGTFPAHIFIQVQKQGRGERVR